MNIAYVSDKYDIKINDIKLPIKKNSVVGKINVLSKNKVVSTGELIVLEDVDKLIEVLKNSKDIFKIII